jgi:hypothetical protein
MAMRNEVFDEIGDAIFAVAVAGAIGLGAANLAVQVNKERAGLDSSAATHMRDQLAYPQRPSGTDARVHEPDSQLNF